MNKVLIITNNYKGFVEQVFLDNISSTTFKFAHTIETILKPYQNKKVLELSFTHRNIHSMRNVQARFHNFRRPPNQFFLFSCSHLHVLE